MKLHKRVVSFLLSLCMLGTSLPVFPAYAVESDLPPIQILSEDPDTPTDVFELTDIAVNQTADVATVSLTASADSTLILALYDENSMFDSISVPITGAAEAQEIEVEIDPGKRGCFTAKTFLLEPETYACLCKKNTTLYTEWQEVKDIAPLETEDIVYEEERNLYYVSDTLVVIFEPDVTLFEIDAFSSAIGGEVIGLDDVLKMYQFRVEAASLDELLELAEEAMEYDYVTYASFDSVTPDATCAVSAVTPNDTWNLDVDAADWQDTDVDGSNWWAEAIDAQYAWAYNDQMEHVLLGVVDQSFDQGHEELKDKAKFADTLMKERNDTTPWDEDDDPETTGIGNQINTHGTHVAGIICADADNEKGITGLVWDSTVALAPAPDLSHTQVYSGISHLVEAGAKVINMSIGMSSTHTKEKPAFSNEDLDYLGTFSAICMARLLDEVGDFILVQSAGNGDSDGDATDAVQNGYFCAITPNSHTASNTTSAQDVIDRVIVVGAAEQDGSGYRCCDFSNFGERVDICAPGRDIMSTIPGRPDNLEFWGGYGLSSGTSMAAPVVTGVCGMVWAACPDLEGDEVKEIVCATARKDGHWVNSNPDWPSPYYYYMVNAQSAVEYALLRAENKAEVTINVKYKDGTPAKKVAISGLGNSYSTNSSGTLTLTLKEGTYNISCTTTTSQTYLEGTEFSVGWHGEQSVTITRPCTINLTLEERTFKWSLDESRKNLTLSGNGPMPDFPVKVTNTGKDLVYTATTPWPKDITKATLNGVTSIGKGAFANCASLTEIEIPNSITRIDIEAFRGCSSLPSINIPDSVTYIGTLAFQGCSLLTEIVIPDSVTSFFGGFSGCTSLTKVKLPVGVTKINTGMLSECSALSSYKIPEGVTTVDNYAFQNCTGLTSITIPDSVTKINKYAFDGCTALKDVYYTGSQTQWNSITIGGINSCLTNATIHYNSTY